MLCPAPGKVTQHLKNMFDVLELKFMLVVVARLAALAVGVSHVTLEDGLSVHQIWAL